MKYRASLFFNQHNNAYNNVYPLFWQHAKDQIQCDLTNANAYISVTKYRLILLHLTDLVLVEYSGTCVSYIFLFLLYLIDLVLEYSSTCVSYIFVFLLYLIDLVLEYSSTCISYIFCLHTECFKIDYMKIYFESMSLLSWSFYFVFELRLDRCIYVRNITSISIPLGTIIWYQ